MNHIQRKFLISADIKRWLEKQTVSLEKTEQFYTKSKSDTTCYYLKVFPQIYIKVSIDNEGIETRVEINEEEYALQRQKHIGRKLAKKSYTVLFPKETFVFTEYSKKLKGLYLLTLISEIGGVVRDSKTLETLEPFILKEIEKDEKYNDKPLALSVKPMEYNLAKFFEKIDAFESANLFFWQVPMRLYIRDGVVLVLYKNLRLLHHYKVNFQRKHMSATLHRLRVLMRRTATILDTFSDLFNPNVERFCRDLLLNYHEQTKVLRYLYFLEELSSTRENAKLSLYSELKGLISQEEKAVTQILLAPQFGQLIQILTRELYEEGYQKHSSLNKEVKKAVRKSLKVFESQLAQTKDGYDEVLLEELYASMDSLQTLIEDFYHIIGQEKTRILVDEINILLKPLREYKNCKERAILLKEIKDQSENSILEVDPLLCEHIEELKEKIDNALKLLRTSRFYV